MNIKVTAFTVSKTFYYTHWNIFILSQILLIYCPKNNGERLKLSDMTINLLYLFGCSEVRKAYYSIDAKYSKTSLLKVCSNYPVLFSLIMRQCSIESRKISYRTTFT